MKKRMIAFLLLLAILLAFSACTEYNPAIDPVGTGNDDGSDESREESSSEEDGTEDESSSSEPESKYVITVTFGGEPYLPDMSLSDDEALKVRLTDGKTYHTERLGADGTLTVEGLDGDYTVTLLDLPEKIGRSRITYDPNIYTVGNDNSEIEIELLAINTTTADADEDAGSDRDNAINLGKTGVYRSVIKSEGKAIFHMFTPKNAGRYAIESMMDISANMYNPKVEIYKGNAAAGYWNYIETIDGGGSFGSYTKNFRHIIEVDEDVLGASYLFAVLVEGVDAVYPVNVDFKISYLGSYEADQTISSLIAPSTIPGSNAAGVRDDTKYNKWFNEVNAQLKENMALFGSSNYTDAAIRTQNRRIFDQSYYKLNPDDGFYYVYDLEKYPLTNGYGPILYADITSPCIFFDTSLSNVEYAGSNALTVSEGTVNYKLFIEGYDSLIYAHSTKTGPYFCVSNCPCYLDYQNGVPGNNQGACSVEDACKRCASSCRHPVDAMKFQKGYADIVNDDGRAPVTEELKTFLQLYSMSKRLFADGNGIVEAFEPRYDGYEDSQWLFACGYYYD